MESAAVTVSLQEEVEVWVEAGVGDDLLHRPVFRCDASSGGFYLS